MVVAEGGDINAAVSYGKHSSSDRLQKRPVERLAEDIANGRVILVHEADAKNIQGQSISPLAVVGKKLNSRLI